jgi:hypothetical protein
MGNPNWSLKKTWLYHITAINNLKSMIRSGYIYAVNYKNLPHTSIANEEVQERRACKQVKDGPGGVIHDYVPFYFAPRSPMLYVNHKKSIANAKPQEDIIHLVTYAQKVQEAKIPFVFYDRHAVVEYASVYSSLADLNKIDWEIFFEDPLLGGYAQYWNNRDDENHPKWANRQEIRQAEFLVYHAFPWHLVKGIATIDNQVKNNVENILNEFGITIPVIAKKEWYYE